MKLGKSRYWSKGLTGLIALFSIVLVACGAAATATPVPAAPAEPTALPAAPSAGDIAPTPAPEPTKASSSGSGPAPTAVPKPTARPAPVVSAKDDIVLVTTIEPNTTAPWDQCGANTPGFVCTDAVVDPLTWVDNDFKEVIGTAATESWEQTSPDRWRFTLRQGVTFHNGEPWNAAAAKIGIDLIGVPNELEGYSFHGDIEAEIVDDYTIDIQCLDKERVIKACPIFPRTAAWTSFLAPEWYASTSEDEHLRSAVGFGPYRMLEWDPGIKITLEAFEDYVPSGNSVEMQAPSIKNVTQVWRGEETVRAAMVQAGEADWAMDIGFENTDNMPKIASGFNNEIFALLVDTVWHPELKKKKVRQALAHAIDCQALVDALYNGLVDCWGNTSADGTAGITPRNSAPYEYDPEMSKQLLIDAEYDDSNVINVYTRNGRVQKDVEFYEGVVGYWREIGVNAELKVIEGSINSDFNQTGCGRTEDPIRCHEFGPPPRSNASPHTMSTATSNEILDYIRQARLRSSCFATRSKICDQEIDRLIVEADPIPIGPERTAVLTKIADIVHDEYYYFPAFQVVVVYGMAGNLDWEPRYDPRLRVNAMRFTN
jgi:peptide/nickel transport system substrate-binding protein